MEKELAHSLNIKLSDDILHRLREEQNKLLEKFNERRMYDSSPHLSIATKFMGASDTDKFIKALKNEFKNDGVWELKFTDFKPSKTQDYIFLHLDFESDKKIVNFHERAFNATKRIGLEIQTDTKFRHFEYSPHISIIKIAPEEMTEAIGMIKNDFSGVKMLVHSFYITRQTDKGNGFSDFPTIDEIKFIS